MGISKKIIFSVLILGLLAGGFFNIVKAQERSGQEALEIIFFFSSSCPHCAAEKVFLDELQERYPEIIVSRHDIFEKQNIELVKKLYEEYEVPKEKWGLVPATFTNDNYFIGFDEGTSKDLEICVQECIIGENGAATTTDNKITLPLIGEIDMAKYSLPALAIVLGFFDGFNVCSLGALVLILGLVLMLKSRKKVLIFGSIFILSAGFVYGLLIVLWFQIFSFFAPYLKLMQILIGLLSVGGGLYFFKEFLKYRKFGPTCEVGSSSSIISKFTAKMKLRLEKQGSVVVLILSVLLFAVVITIVEFPCSAAVPMVFAGMLAQAGLSAWQGLLYIAIFVLFYMLDEIIIFLIAFFTMNLKLSSPKFTTWVALIEALILFALGAYYLFGFLIF